VRGGGCWVQRRCQLWWSARTLVAPLRTASRGYPWRCWVQRCVNAGVRLATAVRGLFTRGCACASEVGARCTQRAEASLANFLVGMAPSREIWRDNHCRGSLRGANFGFSWLRVSDIGWLRLRAQRVPRSRACCMLSTQPRHDELARTRCFLPAQWAPAGGSAAV